MKFTFGIIAGSRYGEEVNDENINKIIDSIEAQNIPEYEVRIIGNSKATRNFTYVHTFDESIKPNWITKKKNILTQVAQYENIVYLHDYITFEPGWYEGFLKFGDDWKVCSNIQVDAKGERWVDWALWIYDASPYVPGLTESRAVMLPYDVTDLSRFMYIGGQYWIAKKHVMKEFPLDERYSWGDPGGEDVLWSQQVRRRYDFSFNSNSVCRYLKEKGNPFNNATQEVIDILRSHGKART